MSEFSGFSNQTVTFLDGLGRNNNKAWFEAHRADYNDHYIAPAKAFIEALTAPLGDLAPNIVAAPRVNGSIFRINRDIRFSKDKTPYKDHLDLWFWEGERKSAVSSFFFRLTATHLILGVGAHQFVRQQLHAYRDAVVDPHDGPALIKTVNRLEKTGHPVRGLHYSKLPRGYAAASTEQDRLLRHNALFASVEARHPTELRSAALVSHCIDIWRPLAPLHHWLIAALE